MLGCGMLMSMHGIIPKSDNPPPDKKILPATKKTKTLVVLSKMAVD
jgi:hypothetical protein